MDRIGGSGIIMVQPFKIFNNAQNLTFHLGKLHSVAYSVSVQCQAFERAVEGPLRDKGSFLR